MPCFGSLRRHISTLSQIRPKWKAKRKETMKSIKDAQLRDCAKNLWKFLPASLARLLKKNDLSTPGSV